MYSNSSSGGAFQIISHEKAPSTDSFKFMGLTSRTQAEQFSILKALTAVKDTLRRFSRITVFTRQPSIMKNLVTIGLLNQNEHQIASILKQLNRPIHIKSTLLMKEHLKPVTLAAQQAKDGTLPFSYCFYNKSSARNAVDRYIRTHIDARYANSGDSTLKKFFPIFHSVPHYITPDKHQTQVFTGHGDFAYRLWRKKKLPSPNCNCSPNTIQTAQHLLIECPDTEALRSNLVDSRGETYSVTDIPDFIRPQSRYTNFKKATEKITEIIQKNAPQTSHVLSGFEGHPLPHRSPSY